LLDLDLLALSLYYVHGPGPPASLPSQHGPDRTPHPLTLLYQAAPSQYGGRCQKFRCQKFLPLWYCAL